MLTGCNYTTVKKILLITSLLACMLSSHSFGQNFIKKDTSFYSNVLQEVKNIDVFLPPGYYDMLQQQYAVIYYMHGAGGDQNSGYGMALDYYNNYFQNTPHDYPPAIIVCMDASCEPYSGSFYVNSILYGNYDDYIIQDVIGFTESVFRAVPDKFFRFVTGWSMGGFGSAYHAVRHPDVFRACVPCIGIMRATSDTVIDKWKELVYQETGSYALNYNAGMHNRLLISSCGAWSPNMDVPPYFIETPFDTLGNNVDTVLLKWEAFDVCRMLAGLPDEDELAWFLIAGKYDHMGFYPTYLELMDSMDHHGIAYDSSYFNGGHSYDEASWIKAANWIDSIIAISFITQGVPPGPISHHEITIFPNPANAFLRVKAPAGRFDVMIYSLSGQLIMHKACTGLLDVSSLAAGIYILEARMEKTVVREKFVKRQ